MIFIENIEEFSSWLLQSNHLFNNCKIYACLWINSEERKKDDFILSCNDIPLNIYANKRYEVDRQLYQNDELECINKWDVIYTK